MCSQITRRELLVQALSLGGASLLPGLAFGQNISYIKGNVLVNGKYANKSTIIKPGDSIITTKKASIVFVVDQDAYKLGSRSTLILRRSSGVINTLRLLTGSLLAVFAPSNKIISTPTVTAGIRGTGIFAQVEESKQRSYFCTCYGEVELNSVKGENKDSGNENFILKASHHNARYIGGDINNPTIENAPMINHTDEELIMLESLLGRKPPFV